MQPETLTGLLSAARQQLIEAGIDTAYLDARLLLQHAAAIPHETLIAEPLRPVTPEVQAAFDNILQRRLNREPVSRILCEREFYGRTFKLGPAVLDPRPATETLIDAALVHLKDESHILDLGTGSGAIIITLLAESPAATGLATDISANALEMAEENAEINGVSGRLTVKQSAWFEKVDGRFDLIVSNPPYIPAGEIDTLAPEVKNFDPHLALDGGADGLDAYRQIALGAAAHLRPDGNVLIEIGAGQSDDVTAIFSSAGWIRTGFWNDLANHIRCQQFAACCSNASK